MIHAVTWVNLEGIMLRERSADMEVTQCTIPFTINIQNKQIYRESKTSSCQEEEGGGKGMGRDCLKGKGPSSQSDKNTLELDSDNSCVSLRMQ